MHALLNGKLYFLINFYTKPKEYLSSSGNQNAIKIDLVHHATFHEWFKLFVAQLVDSGEHFFEEIQTLAEGPHWWQGRMVVTINCYNFHTKSYDAGRPTQSSGVALVSQVSGNEKKSIQWCNIKF
jgi:hypothetical protein